MSMQAADKKKEGDADKKKEAMLIRRKGRG
jgi:hypothetical protein